MAVRIGQGMASTFAPISQSSTRTSRAVPHVSCRQAARFGPRKALPSLHFRACSAGMQQHERASILKEELFRAIEEAKEGLDERCLAAVASLEQLQQVPDIRAHSHLLKGCLVSLQVKFRENRADGKQRYLGFQGSRTTLGAATFNALKPSDLSIALYTGQQLVAMESSDSYVLVVDVEIDNPSAGKEPILGQISNNARFAISGSSSMEIEFISADIKPRFPENDLADWLLVFKDANPDMDDDGCVSVSHQKPIKGRTDILYMDDEIRIHRGNKGGVSVLRLLESAM